MTREEINEGNKIINAFMGFPYNIKEYPDQIAYHTSWDWQIPAWSKLCKEITELIDKEIITDILHFQTQCSWYQGAIKHNSPNRGFEILVQLHKWHNTQVTNP